MSTAGCRYVHSVNWTSTDELMPVMSRHFAAADNINVGITFGGAI